MWEKSFIQSEITHQIRSAFSLNHVVVGVSLIFIHRTVEFSQVYSSFLVTELAINLRQWRKVRTGLSL